MRPSSSPSEPALDALPPEPPPGLFDEVTAHGPARAAVADPAWLRHLLAAEAALATAQAELGIIPPAAAVAIAAACRPERFDLTELARAAAGPGNPVPPLVTALRSEVGGEAAEYVHYGTTSQDLLDTAAMLITRDALEPLYGSVSRAAGAAARLARTHRDTPMAGRTLLQHARPVTFGLVAAGWLAALSTAAGLLTGARDLLAVQLGGPVGTLEAYRDAGPRLVVRFAAALGLPAPALPWHTDRTRVGQLAGLLGTVAGAAGKVARDVTLLASSEVGELAEGSHGGAAGQTSGASEAEPPPVHGGSSAMPHKRNPAAAVSALASAAQAPGLVATLQAAMVQEHQRAAGAWQAEWRPLRELLVTTGSAAQWLSECLAGLVVDEDRMAVNLARLAHTVGLADPTEHLGAAGELVDRALAAHPGYEEEQ
ncbi:MAG: 3-carboxy-cis,cis-muconate cycloisomerase [Micromonosporaceae bacterium]|nr:3-carboxy-cis,cis-muconate cycloisomerase [Micromonosporaceae bacterium]